MTDISIQGHAQRPLAPSGEMRLPGWREDMALQAAPRAIDGAPHWNLYDPVRNRFFRIGWLEFMLLSNWQSGITIDQLCAIVKKKSPLQPNADDVLSLLHFLRSNELLHAGQREQRGFLFDLANRRKLSVWKWLLHHYLFVRIPLVRPEAFLCATLHWFEKLARPAVFFGVGMLSLLGIWRVVDQWQAFSQTFLYFFSLQGALCYAAVLALTKLLHELGHAYVAKHYGLRVPTMGVAIMMLWPLLYTDTSEGWKLGSRRARLAIGSAGIVVELMLAGLAAFAWSILPDGPLKSATYILAAVTWVSTLLVNVNPFMRFDGYYLLMDALDIPNLSERSFAITRWQMRRWLLGVEAPMPEPQLEERRAWLTAYGFATWIYRLIMFTGIAATVYYLFFKFAGLILFGVEIGWFVLRPLWNELNAWSMLRAQWGKRARVSALVGLAGLLVLALPWRSTVTADGYWQAARHTGLYPPMPANVRQILVKEGQQMHKGDPLFVLRAPEVDSQLRQLQSSIDGLQVQINGAIGAPGLVEHVQILERQLAATRAEYEMQSAKAAQLTIAAPYDGAIRDLDGGVYAGGWVAEHHLLARVVDASTTQAHVFVSESDIARIRLGASARVFSRRHDSGVWDATVVGIDKTASRQLPEAMLSSTHGGPIAARAGPLGEALANEALFRITLNVDGVHAQQMALVSAHIEGERSSLLWNFLQKVMGVVIRETGI